MGTASEFASSADGVSMGVSANAHGDELLIVCISTVSASTGAVVSHLLNALPIEFGGKRGEQLADKWQESFFEHVTTLENVLFLDLLKSLGTIELPLWQSLHPTLNF